MLAKAVTEKSTAMASSRAAPAPMLDIEDRRSRADTTLEWESDPRAW